VHEWAWRLRLKITNADRQSHHFLDGWAAPNNCGNPSQKLLETTALGLGEMPRLNSGRAKYGVDGR
jgi:hypothetical protein